MAEPIYPPRPAAPAPERVTTTGLREMKRAGRRIAMLTAYDYPTARLLDEAGIDVLLVGDSLGNVVLGYDTTLPVTLDDIAHHTRAVARAARRALVVADMPFLTFQVSVAEAVRNGGRLLQEGGAQAVKLEGGGPVLRQVRALVRAGIPVMAHLGLTPQSVHQLGGYRVQGRTPDAARQMLDDARRLEEAGAFSLVLEAIPSDLAADITAALRIPTVGIGAGPHCDGQVLVAHDMLGLSFGRPAKFVKRYADLAAAVRSAATAYADDVRAGRFPAPEHTYGSTGRAGARTPEPVAPVAVAGLYGGQRA